MSNDTNSTNAPPTPAGRLRVWSCVNTKPGTGKTTSAGGLAMALHELGIRVGVVDADPGGTRLKIPGQARGELDELGRFARWDAMASFPFPVLQMASRDLHRVLPAIADELGVEHLIIDCPPIEDEKSIALSAVLASTTVVVCMCPSTGEENATASVFAVIEDATYHRDIQPETAVLMNRCPPNSPGVTKASKTVLREEGRHVLNSHVNYGKRWLRAHGNPLDVRGTAYQGAALELLAIEERAEAGVRV